MQSPRAQVQSQRWLESKGFTLPSVFVVQGSRGRIAASLGLDIVVDDRPENCLDVAVDSKARAILVWRGDQTALPSAARSLGVAVVSTIAECLDLLTPAKPVESSPVTATAGAGNGAPQSPVGLASAEAKPSDVKLPKDRK